MQYTAHVFQDNVVFAGGIKIVICQVLSSKYIFFIIFYNKENILPISILMILSGRAGGKVTIKLVLPSQNRLN